MYKSMYGWERYINIEEDFITARRYISFDVKNARSDFLTRSVILLGAEIEAAMKKLCYEINNSTPKKMNEYQCRVLISNFYPNINRWKVKMIGTKKEFTPFISWPHKSSRWWTVYTNVKHNSVDKSATLDIALEMLAAYQTMIFIIRVREGVKANETESIACSLANQPKLFIPSGDTVAFSLGGDPDEINDMWFYIALHPYIIDNFLKGC